jgi:hypothetical protein
MKLNFPSLHIALLYAAAILITSQSPLSADDPAPTQRGRHGWGHGRQGGGPGGGMGMGRGRGRGGPMRDDPEFVKDRELFHQLLDNRKSIKRTVKNTDTGILTVTESDDPDVTKWIQQHVASMKKRVEQSRPIHMRDPLFRALFSNTKTIEMKVENTKKGVRVTETSNDPFVAKLIQAHAHVVSLFLKNGSIGVSRNHAVPKEDP